MWSAAASGVAWSSLALWVSRAATFTVFILLARLLPAADLGLVAFVAAIIAWIAPFTDQGLGQAIVQRETLDEDSIHTAFWLSSASGLVLAGATAASAPLVAIVMDDPRTIAVVVTLSSTVFISGLGSIPLALLRRRLDFRLVALRQAGSAFIGGTVGVVMALMGMGVWSLVGRSMAQSVFSFAVIWFAARYRPRARFRRADVRALVGFGWSCIGVQTMNAISRRGDDIVVGAVLGPEALGFYSVAYRVVGFVIEMFGGVVQSVAIPMLAQVYRDRPPFWSLVLAAGRYTLAVATVIFALVSVFATELVVGLFGERWLTAAPIMSVLAIAGACQTVVVVGNAGLVASGRPGSAFRVAAVASPVEFLLFLAVASFGVFWVGAAHAFGTVAVLLPLHVRAVHRAAVADNAEAELAMVGIGRQTVATVAIVSGLVAGKILAQQFGWWIGAGAVSAAIVTYGLILTDGSLRTQLSEVRPRRRARTSSSSSSESNQLANVDDNGAVERPKG